MRESVKIAVKIAVKVAKTEDRHLEEFLDFYL
jgi:hypothetical protein